MSRYEPGPAAGPGRLWPLLVVLIGVAVGLVLAFVDSDSWRLGALVIGGSLLVGSLIRLVLPDRAAGLLGVRSKALDIAALAFLGVAIVILALEVPPAR